LVLNQSESDTSHNNAGRDKPQHGGIRGIHLLVSLCFSSRVDGPTGREKAQNARGSSSDDKSTREGHYGSFMRPWVARRLPCRNQH
jgi:hypothetical protein